jgi:uncharacterized protein with HEPN domain
MSEKRLLQDYLNDILESITDIEDFTKGMTFEVFSKDRKTIKAVVRSLEVIGEAANKIPNNIQENYPEIPWTEIVGMRNRLIHEYFGVDIDIVWETIKEDLDPLKAVVKKMLSDLYGIQ